MQPDVFLLEPSVSKVDVLGVLVQVFLKSLFAVERMLLNEPLIFEGTYELL